VLNIQHAIVEMEVAVAGGSPGKGIAGKNHDLSERDK
jgi:hypothetical protein